MQINDRSRHENFHANFSLCAEYFITSIIQKLICRSKVFTDYSDVLRKSKSL